MVLGYMVDENQVWEALKTVIDPELNVNIVDLGLIYGVEISRFSGETNVTRSTRDDFGDLDSLSPESSMRVVVEMTLTTPGCPLGGYFVKQVESVVSERVEVNEEQVRVKIVWDPPWSQELMSDEVKMELGFD